MLKDFGKSIDEVNKIPIKVERIKIVTDFLRGPDEKRKIPEYLPEGQQPDYIKDIQDYSLTLFSHKLYFNHLNQDTLPNFAIFKVSSKQDIYSCDISVDSR